uniref:Ribosomal protein S13 n=1 Tax=prasinophyte sp. MBIC10622 TaxID=156113 RepID=A0A650AKJ4_9CHLO|nr:ribosomal protein S13 [prasinophyte sp. MBIC10622]
MQILGVYFDNRSSVRYALTEVYGLGKTSAKQICDQLGLSHTYSVGALTLAQIDRLTYLVHHHYSTGPTVRRAQAQDVKRLVTIGTYRGFRHVHGLPARGQRTSTNSRTARRVRVFRK